MFLVFFSPVAYDAGAIAAFILVLFVIIISCKIGFSVGGIGGLILGFFVGSLVGFGGLFQLLYILHPTNGGKVIEFIIYGTLTAFLYIKIYMILICIPSKEEREKKKAKEAEFEELKRSAQQGDVEASYQVGEHYRSINNLDEEIKWFKMAADKGHEGAKKNLAEEQKTIKVTVPYYEISTAADSSGEFDVNDLRSIKETIATQQNLGWKLCAPPDVVNLGNRKRFFNEKSGRVELASDHKITLKFKPDMY
jgi:TPR repeat protein